MKKYNTYIDKISKIALLLRRLGFSSQKISCFILSIFLLGGVSSMSTSATYIIDDQIEYEVNNDASNYPLLTSYEKEKEVYYYNDLLIVKEKIVTEGEYLSFLKSRAISFLDDTINNLIFNNDINNDVSTFDVNLSLINLLKKDGSIIIRINNDLYRIYIDSSLVLKDGRVYTEKELLYNMSYDEKLEYVLDKYNMSKYEFDVILSVVYNEAAKQNYDDSYRVINTIFNRTISSVWSNYITSITGINGKSLYAQVIASGQFEVYSSDYSGYDTSVTYGTDAYNAVLDFLTYGVRTHNLLSFKSNGSNISGSRFTSSGNVYHNEMSSSEIDSNYEYEIDRELYDNVLSHEYIMDYIKRLYEITDDNYYHFVDLSLKKGVNDGKKKILQINEVS